LLVAIVDNPSHMLDPTTIMPVHTPEPEQVVFAGHVTETYAVPCALHWKPVVEEVQVPVPGLQGASGVKPHLPFEQTSPAWHVTPTHPDPSDGHTRTSAEVTHSELLGGHVVAASAFAAQAPPEQTWFSVQPVASQPDPSAGQLSAIFEVRHCCALGVQAVPASEAQTPFVQVSPGEHARGSHPEPSEGQIRASELVTHCFVLAGQAGPASPLVLASVFPTTGADEPLHPATTTLPPSRSATPQKPIARFIMMQTLSSAASPVAPLHTSRSRARSPHQHTLDTSLHPGAACAWMDFSALFLQDLTDISERQERPGRPACSSSACSHTPRPRQDQSPDRDPPPHRSRPLGSTP